MKRTEGNSYTRRSFIQKTSMVAAGASLTLFAPRSVQAGTSDGASTIGETAFGRVRGVVNSGVNVFKGIPYGADTSGANRFMPAVDPASWVGVRDALAYGDATPQNNPATGRQQDGHESEDCLVLNVWSRGLRDGGKRPVMFWIHGGGFRSLSGSSPGYDGTNLCNRGDVVVVTINHRRNCIL